MTPEQYHEVLIGLDRALFVFHEAGVQIDSADRALIARINALRDDVYRVGSAHPFSSATAISGVSPLDTSKP